MDVESIYTTIEQNMKRWNISVREYPPDYFIISQNRIHSHCDAFVFQQFIYTQAK